MYNPVTFNVSKDLYIRMENIAPFRVMHPYTAMAAHMHTYYEHTVRIITTGTSCTYDTLMHFLPAC